MTLSRFADRIVLVTGAASGIGAATAVRLASEGARVAVADIDDVGAKEVADSIGGFAVHLDVTENTSVRTGVAEVRSELGSIDVLVNNAGGDQLALFVDTDEAMWDRAL